jgi:aryl-alcohol dehydrogenase-like predicted oxidoreductase
MDYTHLGRSGLSVSRLCLGTMNFGPETSEDDSHAIMDRALDLGINFFDTANVYGWKKGEGITEQIVGRWFAQGGGRREKTVIATKLYGSMSDWPNDTFLSARNIRRACDESLRRLQTDYLDLYQMHHVDRDTPWDEIYNLLTRDIELEVLPACLDYGVGVIPWSPLHGGLLGGIIRKTEQGKRRLGGRAKDGLKANRKAIKAWEDLCDELGENPADVGLAWLLAQPGVTAPIIGPRTMAQLDGAQRALKVRLTKDVLARLDEIFPGPGGPAPEAYAW